MRGNGGLGMAAMFLGKTENRTPGFVGSIGFICICLWKGYQPVLWKAARNGILFVKQVFSPSVCASGRMTAT
jgi:hypothetical protein